MISAAASFRRYLTSGVHRTTVYSAVAATTLLVAASGTLPAQQVQTPAPLRVVNSPAPLWGETNRWTFQRAPLLRVGSADGSA